MRDAELQAAREERDLAVRDKMDAMRIKCVRCSGDGSDDDDATAEGKCSGDEKNGSSLIPELLRKAWEQRDGAVRRKNAVQVQLARTRVDVLQANGQLMEAIGQKVELSQQLEQWQVSGGTVFVMYFFSFLPLFVNRYTENVSSPTTRLGRKIHDPNVPGVWMDRGFFSFAPEKLRVYRAVTGRRQQETLAWDAILSKADLRGGGETQKLTGKFGNKNDKYLKKCRLNYSQVNEYIVEKGADISTNLGRDLNLSEGALWVLATHMYIVVIGNILAVAGTIRRTTPLSFFGKCTRKETFRYVYVIISLYLPPPC